MPGDEILGFVTKGRGISVHRDDCANASELADYSGARQVEVDWDASFSGQFRTSIEVRALDRDRLLVNVVEIISDHHLSISSAQTFTGDDQVSILQFDIEVGDPTLLEQLLGAVRERQAPFIKIRSSRSKSAGDFASETSTMVGHWAANPIPESRPRMIHVKEGKYLPNSHRHQGPASWRICAME